jgi:hypothetical protein
LGLIKLKPAYSFRYQRRFALRNQPIGLSKQRRNGESTDPRSAIVASQSLSQSQSAPFIAPKATWNSA